LQRASSVALAIVVGSVSLVGLGSTSAGATLARSDPHGSNPCVDHPRQPDPDGRDSNPLPRDRGPGQDAESTQAGRRPGESGGGGTGSTDPVTNPKFMKSVTVSGKTYTSDPGGLTLNPGQTVSVALTWAPSLFEHTPDQVWDCVFFGEPGRLGGEDLGSPYDTFQRPATADPFVTSFTAQAAWAGRTVGDRGRVVGDREDDVRAAWEGSDDGTFRSNQFCFFVNPAARVPEAPWPALLVVTAVVLSAGVLIVRRRRGAATAGSA
jgi:hypothetical protein